MRVCLCACCVCACVPVCRYLGCKYGPAVHTSFSHVYSSGPPFPPSLFFSHTLLSCPSPSLYLFLLAPFPSQAKEEEWSNMRLLRGEIAGLEERCAKKDKQLQEQTGRLTESFSLMQKLSAQLEAERGEKLASRQELAAAHADASARIGAAPLPPSIIHSPRPHCLLCPLAMLALLIMMPICHCFNVRCCMSKHFVYKYRSAVICWLFRYTRCNIPPLYSQMRCKRRPTQR